MVPKKKESRWRKIRSAFRTVHLYMGIVCGLIIIPVCFSGTLYVFNKELSEWSAPHLYKTQNEGMAPAISADSAASLINLSSEGKITTMAIYNAANRTYQFNTKTKDDKSKSGIAWFVDPYKANVVGNSENKTGTEVFMSNMFSLHRWLLLDKVETPIVSGMTNRELGSSITGWATILFTLGCLTGLVIWFPSKVKNWRQGLKIKWSGNWKRINHDLHNTLAFYALIFLLIMGLTGPQWSFPWYRDGLQKTLGTYKAPIEKDKKEKKGGPEMDAKTENTATIISLAQCLQIADDQLNYPGDYQVRFPNNEEPNFTVSKTKLGFFATAAGDKVIINAQTGEVKKVEIFSDKPFNERIAGSIKALHVGNVYGTFTKIIYFLACLIATSLPITGTIIWINRLKKKKQRKGKTVREIMQKELERA